VIRLLLDQGLPVSTAAHLRTARFDALHVAEIGMSRATDAAILEHAEAERRVVATLDADFHTLLALSAATGPSVIRIRQEGLQGAELATLLARIVAQAAESLKAGAAVIVTPHTVRIRRLPIPQVP
jgi:predicted nuclease of predicted toxin-antitoxin system